MFLAESSIQLVPDGTLLLHLLMIGVMVAFLNRTLLKPINKILEEREKYVSGKMSEAEKILKNSEEKFNEYQAKLRGARTEGYHLLEKVRAQAVKDKDDKVKTFKEQNATAVAAELEATHQQEQQVKKELDAQAATLGALITSQILERH